MKGRVAFVTGAGQGIGRCCALELARAGARVALGARSADKLEAVAEEIRAAGGEACVAPLDLGSVDSVRDAFKKAAAEAGPIEILVNNAAVTRDGIAMRMPADAWDEVLQTNLTGAFQCIQQVLRPMSKARWGRIVNISSVVGQAGNPGQANYVSAKAGLIGLTKSLAIEMAPRNITVNAVAPGFVETAMTDVLNDDQRATILDRIPMGRIGNPEEISAAVRFLASDEASYVTGHVLSVNGGMYM